MPELRDVLGSEGWRAQGIETWDDVDVVGSNNVQRLIALVQMVATASVADGASSAERHAIRDAIESLRRRLDAQVAKPWLPRLRNELFRVGDGVMLYVADSEGACATTSWVEGRVLDVSKACRPEWVTTAPNSGFYWQVTARTVEPVFPNVLEVRFSTTEPRALLRDEHRWLQRARDVDMRFVDIFAANAYRDWQPIWSLERGPDARPERMDMRRWLAAA